MGSTQVRGWAVHSTEMAGCSWWRAASGLSATRQAGTQPSCPPRPALPAAGAASLRQRLHQLLTPLLRLVLALVSALPTSSAVREQALAFVDAHARTLTRVLHDAASPGIRCARVQAGRVG